MILHHLQYYKICNIDVFSIQSLILECADWLPCNGAVMTYTISKWRIIK